jgi:hypothetical protein
MSSDTKTAATVGRVSPQGVTRHDRDGLMSQGVGLRCANPTYEAAPSAWRTDEEGRRTRSADLAKAWRVGV